MNNAIQELQEVKLLLSLAKDISFNPISNEAETLLQLSSLLNVIDSNLKDTLSKMDQHIWTQKKPSPFPRGRQPKEQVNAQNHYVI